ncbi:hypothetical protein AGMMS50296_8860 [Alphaproteobacteria bacterium]|nr:hypothetical protein AGMMS50296_8860 [Alphaproteobacteria bacterium]
MCALILKNTMCRMFFVFVPGVDSTITIWNVSGIEIYEKNMVWT